ncbi:putative F-box/LRR-repeat protein 23 [Phragmites australis]|uniref:putative F-box/LRR-repeat protein 23 n=1 Tax=Phragmites australis TaxID=29695 RepID=UPI002D77CB9A|nr:putative F-box/LRR-repeat protein 23 [Phragmites australis]
MDPQSSPPPRSPASRRRRMEAGTDAQPASPLSAKDWSELPLDALSSVFAKLGAVEVLMGAGLVCHSWLDAAKVPYLWRSVDMSRHKLVEEMDGDVLCAMAKVAVDRSGGQLKVFVGKGFVTDELLKYIGDRSPSLKGLGLISCRGVSNEGFTEFITKCPLLHDLLLAVCPNIWGRDVYEATGKACPQLKRFGLRKDLFEWFLINNTMPIGEALGIAAMRELRSLRLIETEVTNDELVAVLDSCPHLELLCLRRCYSISVDGTLREKCAGIKELTFADLVFHQEFDPTDCDRDFDYGSD